ncbi:MAG: hypothetical protein AAFX99_35165 [Myxococcota bacterium]
MSTKQEQPSNSAHCEPERSERERDARRPYTPPRIESSEVFHTVSNGPVPGYCGGYGT